MSGKTDHFQQQDNTECLNYLPNYLEVLMTISYFFALLP